MRTKILLPLILILCLGGVLYYARRDEDERDTRWKDPKAWKGLEKGMTEEQVKQLLGKPGQIIRRSWIRWYYQYLPRETHEYPSHGYLTFRPNGQSSAENSAWLLNDWVEPDWAKVEDNAEMGHPE